MFLISAGATATHAAVATLENSGIFRLVASYNDDHEFAYPCFGMS
jgi:hypothetical protein